MTWKQQDVINYYLWYYGDRDHATVMHACNMVKKHIEFERGYKQNFEMIKGRLDIVMEDMMGDIRALSLRSEQCNYEYPSYEISTEVLQYQRPQCV
jgi:hypothetical protein